VNPKLIPDARTLVTLLGVVLATLQADFPSARWVTGLIAVATVLGVHVTGLTSSTSTSSPTSTSPAPPAS
jgi:hypothetical protein